MRRVIITKSSYLINFAELSNHALVNKCWQLPREYTLIEIKQPKLQDESGGGASSVQAAASLDEASLFAPFYRRSRSLADIAAFHLLTETASYHLITTGRPVLQWPRFHCSGNWTLSKSIQAVCLTTESKEVLHLLEEVFLGWATSMKNLQQLKHLGRLQASLGHEYSVKCDFVSGAGDSLMVLFMLLADTRGVTSIGFQPPEQVAVSDQSLDGRKHPQETNL